MITFKEELRKPRNGGDGEAATAAAPGGSQPAGGSFLVEDGRYEHLLVSASVLDLHVWNRE